MNGGGVCISVCMYFISFLANSNFYRYINKVESIGATHFELQRGLSSFIIIENTHEKPSHNNYRRQQADDRTS